LPANVIATQRRTRMRSASRDPYGGANEGAMRARSSRSRSIANVKIARLSRK
jgi:hypothetical protein